MYCKNMIADVVWKIVVCELVRGWFVTSTCKARNVLANVF